MEQLSCAAGALTIKEALMKQIYYIEIIKSELKGDSFCMTNISALTHGFYCSQKKAKQEVDYLGDLFVKNMKNDAEKEIQDIEKTEVSYSIIYKANGKIYEEEFIYLPTRLDEEED
jgi:hypothetical protein